MQKPIDSSKRRKTGHGSTATPVGQLDGIVYGPDGVAFDSKNKSIVTVDWISNRLKLFSQDGKFLSKLGSHGLQKGQLNFPRGVCIQPATHNVIVTDRDRVQVFSSPHVSSSSADSFSPLASLFSVGSADKVGRGPSQFNDPRGICCTARGDIIVADSWNHRMQIIDCKGRYVRAFGRQGQKNNQFQHPSGVFVQEDANRMIIADSSNFRLCMWSVDGCEPVLAVPIEGYPRGICNYPRTHRIVVSCTGPHDIQVLDSKTKNEWNVIQRF